MLPQSLINKVFAQSTDMTLQTNTFKGTGEDLSSALAYVTRIISVALDISAIIGIFLIFYSAILYLSSFGDDAKAETAKKTLLWAAIGTLVVVGAHFIVQAVGNMLG